MIGRHTVSAYGMTTSTAVTNMLVVALGTIQAGNSIFDQFNSVDFTVAGFEITSGEHVGHFAGGKTSTASGTGETIAALHGTGIGTIGYIGSLSSSSSSSGCFLGHQALGIL